MHYYQFNIADYRKKTGHLSLVEHAIYRALIDTYYLTENPLTSDINSLMRLHSVRTADEKLALENVLSDFFELTEQGYIHEHCHQELDRLYQKSEKARNAAKARWLKTKGKDKDAMQTHNGCNADGILPIDPIPNNPTPINNNIGADAPCPHIEIIDLYHSCLPELTAVKKSLWPGSAREKMLRARWKQSDQHQTLEFWENLFNHVSNSDFLMGRNNANFRGCNLEWIVKPANFIKIIEGNYHE